MFLQSREKMHYNKLFKQLYLHFADAPSTIGCECSSATKPDGLLTLSVRILFKHGCLTYTTLFLFSSWFYVSWKSRQVFAPSSHLFILRNDKIYWHSIGLIAVWRSHPWAGVMMTLLERSLHSTRLIVVFNHDICKYSD